MSNNSGRHMKGKADRKHSFKYREQYGVIVICKDEAEQRRVYEQLLAKGFTLRVVTV